MPDATGKQTLVQGKITSLEVMDYTGGTGCKANIFSDQLTNIQVTTSSLLLTTALQTFYVLGQTQGTEVSANYVKGDGNNNLLFIATKPS